MYSLPQNSHFIILGFLTFLSGSSRVQSLSITMGKSAYHSSDHCRTIRMKLITSKTCGAEASSTCVLQNYVLILGHQKTLDFVVEFLFFLEYQYYYTGFSCTRLVYHTRNLQIINGLLRTLID